MLTHDRGTASLRNFSAIGEMDIDEWPKRGVGRAGGLEGATVVVITDAIKSDLWTGSVYWHSMVNAQHDGSAWAGP